MSAQIGIELNLSAHWFHYINHYTLLEEQLGYS